MADAIPPTSPTAVHYKRGTAGPTPDPGDGGLGGTTHNVTGDLQAFMGGATMKAGSTPALNGDGTHKGNTYEVPAGSTHGMLAFPAAIAGGNNWTRIISGGTLPARGTIVQPSDASQLFKVATPSTGLQSDAAISLSVATQGWILIGAEATHGGSASRARLVHLDTVGNGFLSRLIFERCYIHPGVGQLGCANSLWVADAEDFQAYDCWVVGTSGYFPTALVTDGKALFLRRGRRIHVEHNELQGTGENVILGDRYSGSPSLDVTIARNHLFKPLSWFRWLGDGSLNNTGPTAWDGVQWALKNNFEIKCGQRVLVVGNHCENNLATPSTGTPFQSDQAGEAMTMNAGYDTTDGQPNVPEPIADIEWRSNLVENAVGLFQLSAGFVISDPVNHVPRRIWIHNNLGKKVGGRFTLLNKGWQDTVIEHNTNVPGDRSNLPPVNAYQLYLAGFEWQSYDQTTLYPNLTIRRNAFGHCASSFTLKDGGSQMTAARAATILPGSTLAENAIIGPVGFTMPAGFTAHASPAAAGINTTTGVLDSNSPLKAGGANGGSDGKDLGVDFGELADDMTGAPTAPVAAFLVNQAATPAHTMDFVDISH